MDGFQKCHTRDENYAEIKDDLSRKKLKNNIFFDAKLKDYASITIF